jgi:ATP-dependent DNA ligase
MIPGLRAPTDGPSGGVAESLDQAIACSRSRDGERARLLSRRGIDWGDRFPAIIGAIEALTACALGCEGIVSKRRGSRYVAGRTDHWLKVKNPDAPAVRREANRIGDCKNA